MFNTSEDDDTAYRIVASTGDQFQESDNNPTYVRATGTGWELIADGELVP